MKTIIGKSGGMNAHELLVDFRLRNVLWSDLKSDEEKADFISCGRAWETGIIAKTMENELADAFRRLSRKNDCK